MFTDRTDAGHRLADALQQDSVEADIVLGIPRGGLPVARPVADALGVPLDVVVAKKVGAPGNPELAVAAVADDGTTWRNESLIGSLDVTVGYLEDEIEREQRAAQEKFRRYRDGDPTLDLAGKRVLVVDDGLATGATMHACVKRVKAAGAANVVVALPVGAPSSIDEIERATDRVIALEEPQSFGAVGSHYRDFRQVTDEEAIALMEG